MVNHPNRTLRGSITSANAVFVLSAPEVFDNVMLSGFAPGLTLWFEQVPAGPVRFEDGRLIADYKEQPYVQRIKLMADSTSNGIFDAWHSYESKYRVKIHCQGRFSLPSIGMHYVLSDGIMTSYCPAPYVSKILEPRSYEITWSNVMGAAL